MFENILGKVVLSTTSIQPYLLLSHKTIIETIDGGECRARSDCTYVQADLTVHSPKKKYPWC